MGKLFFLLATSCMFLSSVGLASNETAKQATELTVGSEFVITVSQSFDFVIIANISDGGCDFTINKDALHAMFPFDVEKQKANTPYIVRYFEVQHAYKIPYSLARDNC